ncbi:MAG TPA: kelch repeat-containing protein [Blastocatellia bacterium]
MIGSALPSVSALPAGWNAASPMHTGRFAAGAVVLPSGRVLVVGGHSQTTGSFIASAELYDPVTDSWMQTASLPSPHRYIATLLKTGEVLVVGDDTSSLITPTGYLYNEATAAWTATGTPSIARYSGTATLLNSGRVLLVGGYNGGCCSGPKATYKSAEIYNRKKNSWLLTASMRERRLGHTATLLASGKVLVAGGTIRDPIIPHNSAEIYDPDTGTWSPTGPMTTPRFFHKATLLPSGKVLVTGGFKDALGVALASAEVYDPATGTWTAIAPMTFARGRHTAVLMSSGKLLVAGGLADNSDNASALDSAELYDSSSGTWTSAGTMAGKRAQHIAVLLGSDRMLVAGGTGETGNEVKSAEVYVAAQSNMGDLVRRRTNLLAARSKP